MAKTQPPRKPQRAASAPSAGPGKAAQPPSPPPAKPRKSSFLSNPEFLRRQSLLLVLAGLVYLILLIAPFVIFDIDNGAGMAILSGSFAELSGAAASDSAAVVPPPIVSTGLLVLGAILCFYPLALYTKRKSQIRFVRLAFFYSLFVPVGIFCLQWFLAAVNFGLAHVAGNVSITQSAGWGAFLVPLPLLLTFLAVRGVQSDIRRVRSSERFW